MSTQNGMEKPVLFPAHAGVILRKISQKQKRYPFPCTRRGDPNALGDFGDKKVLFPAHAGVILKHLSLSFPLSTFPCTRRGDPLTTRFSGKVDDFSLHTQG